MPFARASELDRLFKCAGSSVLPRVRDKDSIAAEWGTKVHAWAETGVLPEGKDGAALGKKIDKAGVSRRKLWPEEGEHEITIALDPESLAVKYCDPPAGAADTSTARRAYADKWKEGFDDTWIVGSIDFGMELIGRPWVDDLKTGRLVSWQDYQAQQTVYAAMYSLWKYGALRETRSTVTHWPRYPVGVAPARMGGTLTVAYLESFMHRLRELRTEILKLKAGGDMRLSYGEHCRFCPSRRGCDLYQLRTTPMAENETAKEEGTDGH